MFYLLGKGANAFEIAALDIQAAGSKAVFVFRHGFSSSQEFPFKDVELVVYDCSYWNRGCLLLRLRVACGRWGCGLLVLALRNQQTGKNKKQQKDYQIFHGWILLVEFN